MQRDKRWHAPYRDPTQEDIKAVTSYLPYFDVDMANSGMQNKFYVGGNIRIDFSPESWKFINALHDRGFIFTMNAQQWPHNEDAIDRFMKNPELLNTADILTIQRFLSWAVREYNHYLFPVNDERHGLISEMIDRGIILRILRRLDQLQHDLEKS